MGWTFSDVPSAVVRELRKIIIRDCVIDPDDVRFDKLRKVWNGMIDRRPAATVQPLETERALKR